MRRDILLLTEMIEAAEQARRLAEDVTAGQLEVDRQRRDALLWNFTVLGKAAGQVSDGVGAVPGHRMAAASSLPKPDRPRLLVDRHPDPAHHRQRATGGFAEDLRRAVSALRGAEPI